MAALTRIKDNTIEARLQNGRGLPNFNVRFFVLNKEGDYAGVGMYASGESTFAVCDENGAREEPLEGLLEGPQRTSGANSYTAWRWRPWSWGISWPSGSKA